MTEDADEVTWEQVEDQVSRSQEARPDLDFLWLPVGELVKLVQSPPGVGTTASGLLAWRSQVREAAEGAIQGYAELLSIADRAAIVIPQEVKAQGETALQLFKDLRDFATKWPDGVTAQDVSNIVTAATMEAALRGPARWID